MTIVANNIRQRFQFELRSLLYKFYFSSRCFLLSQHCSVLSKDTVTPTKFKRLRFPPRLTVVRCKGTSNLKHRHLRLSALQVRSMSIVTRNLNNTLKFLHIVYFSTRWNLCTLTYVSKLLQAFPLNTSETMLHQKRTFSPVYFPQLTNNRAEFEGENRRI